MSSVIPGFGGEEHYVEPLPPHDEEPEMEMENGIKDKENELSDAEVDAGADIVAGASEDVENEEQENGSLKEQFQEQLEEGLLDDDDESDEDDFVVTIGDVKPSVAFISSKTTAPPGNIGKLDIDGTPTINGTPIYDLDLATMEERPWQKPGADLTDYFNYGFNEETWNSYCERQRKLRAEYGNQATANKVLFSSISLTNPLVQSGGRQLQTIPIIGQEKTDFSTFKSAVPLDQTPVIRTVITPGQPPRITTIGQSETSSNNMLQEPSSEVTSPSSSVGASLPTSMTVSGSVPALPAPSGAAAPMDFTKPPPAIESIASSSSGSSAPTLPSAIPSTIPGISSLPKSSLDGPPGVDEPAPPGSSTPPPGFGDLMTPRPIPTLTAGVDTSVPPPVFNPLLPPPGIAGPPTMRLALPNTNIPPPGFTVPPPTFAHPPPAFPPRFSVPVANTPLPRPPPLLSRPNFPPPTSVDSRRNLREEDRNRDRERGRDRDRDSVESDNEEYGRRRHTRRRSRSYSPRDRSRRHRDDRDRDRDSDRYRDKNDRDRDRDNRVSRRHRSRSGSAHENSRSQRRKDDRDKEKDKKKDKSRDKEEIGDKEKEKKEREKDKDDSERNDRERDKDKDKDKEKDKDKDKDKDRERKRRRHKSDDENTEKLEKDKEKKKAKTKDTSVA